MQHIHIRHVSNCIYKSHMHIDMYIYMYTHDTCIKRHIYACICMSHIIIHINIYMCMLIYACIYTNICIYYIDICLYVYEHVYISKYRHK